MINPIKAIVVATVGLFFSLIVFNNLTDFESNKQLVAHIIRLDSVKNEMVAWRGIENLSVHLVIYWSFILSELLAATLCWIGSIRLLKGDKKIALIGLLLGFLIYMVGFVVIASEWFYLWQSDLNAGQIKALLYSILLLACINFVHSKEN